MSASLPATANDVHRMLGEVDPLIVERILATGASTEEIGEALLVAEDTHGFGELPHQPSTPRVAEVCAVLDELDVLDEDAYDDDGRS